MSIAYLALGSNLGHRQKNILSAMDGLSTAGVHIEKTSRIIETDPVGGPAQGQYLNAVIKVNTVLSPEDLHWLTRQIELRLGRIKNVVNGPRIIDIDILLYEDIKLVTRDLQIPHPRMYERDFVMNPLIEIAPVHAYC